MWWRVDLLCQRCTPSKALANPCKTRLKAPSTPNRLYRDVAKPYIVNEAHGLRQDTIRQLLVLLERLPSHVVFIFTTTCDGQDKLFEGAIDAHPLLSRCIPLGLARRDLAKAFAARAREIAEAEGLNGRPIADYVKLAQKHRNNMRAMLQDIETGTMKGPS